MDAVDDYLRLPTAYAEPFGGWRWSADGEAVEDASGKSVVLAAELAAFLGGFAAHSPLIHFGHTVHLLFLLRQFALDPRRPRAGPGRQAARQLARVLEKRPRSLAEALAGLARRERLAGAVPFVARLVGALALPPRRLTPGALAVGGYVDVTTRGMPERLLP